MNQTLLAVAVLLVLAACTTGGAQDSTAAPYDNPPEALFSSFSLAKGVDAHGREWLVLVLADAEGNRGIAPATKNPDEQKIEAWQGLIQKATPHLEGVNLLDHEAFWAALRPHVSPLIRLSALDFAAWDLHARREGVPVYELLGEKKRDKLLVYWSSHLRPRTFEGFVEWARQAAQTKVKAVKVFATHHHNPDEQWPYGGRVDPDEHFRLLKAVRKEIGPDVMLLTDLNFGFTFEQALEFGRRVDADPDINLAYYEEPCRINLEHYKTLTKELDVGISALDIEGHADHEMRIKWVREDALDMCRFDVRANGGITPALKVMEVCRERPDIVLNFHSHQVAAAHILTICTEEETGPWETWGPGNDGYLPIPEGPGMGYDFKLDELEPIESSPEGGR